VKQPIVVVGGVAAGPKIAAKVRREDPDVPIILVTDEQVISYAGCGTPYYLGRTFDQRDKLLVRTAADFGAQNGVTMMLGCRVTKLDPAGHTVDVKHLDEGRTETIAYSKLALTTGARPFVPPLDGLPAEGVFTLRSVTDAFAIDDYIEQQNVRRAVIVGAGYIGLEVAEQFRERGREATVVELMPQVLPRFDVPLAKAVAIELQRLGVELLLETKVEGIAQDHRGRVTGVRTSRGPLPADLVILSIGVRPNAELAAEAGCGSARPGRSGSTTISARAIPTSTPRAIAPSRRTSCRANRPGFRWVRRRTSKGVWRPSTWLAAMRSSPAWPAPRWCASVN